MIYDCLTNTMRKGLVIFNEFLERERETSGQTIRKKEHKWFNISIINIHNNDFHEQQIQFIKCTKDSSCVCILQEKPIYQHKFYNNNP